MGESVPIPPARRRLPAGLLGMLTLVVVIESLVFEYTRVDIG